MHMKMFKRAVFVFLTLFATAGGQAADPGLSMSFGLSSPPPEDKGITASGGRASVAPPAAVPQVKPVTPTAFDYGINLRSDVFGAQLFSGAFAREGATQFNPDYLV